MDIYRKYPFMATADDNDKNAKKALASAKALEKALKGINGEVDKQNQGWNSISNALLGLNKNDFFTKGAGDVQAITAEIAKLKDEALDASSTLNVGFENIIKKAPNSLKNFQKEIAKSSLAGSDMAKGMAKAIETADLGQFMRDFGDEGMEAFKKIVEDKKGFKNLTKFFDTDAVKNLKEIEKETTKWNDQLKIADKEVFSLSKTLDGISKNFAKNVSPQKIVDTMMEFDKSLSDIQKRFNVLPGSVLSTSSEMSHLVRSGSEFGVSMKDSFESVGQLADALKTDNLPTVADTVKAIQMIPGALGASREEVVSIAGSMQFLGASTEEVTTLFKDVAKTSAVFGVNVAKVTAEIARELPKWQKMGFKEGDASLVKFAAHAQKLGISMDSIVKSTEKFQMDLEGSLDAASQLQLVGGKFANANPFDLMSAAQEGPEAFTKLTEGMVEGIGQINKDGKFQIDPVNKKRLSMAADALGMTYDDMFNIAAKSAEKTKKLEMFPPSLFQGMDDESKEFLLKSTDLTSKKITIDGKVYGVDEMSKLSQSQIKSAMEKTKTDAADLEKRNKQNQSLKETFDNLVNSFLNIFTMFEPALKVLAKGITFISTVFSKFGEGLDKIFGSGSEAVKGIIALTAALMFAFGPSGMVKKLIPGLTGKIGGLFGGGKGGETPGANLASGSKDMTKSAGEGVKGFFSGFAEGIKAFGSVSIADLGKFALALGIVGGAIIGFSYAMAKVGGEASVGQMATAGVSLVLLGGSIFLMSKIMKGVDMGSILKGSLAMVLIGASLIPFAFAMQMLEGISWETLAKAAVGIIGLTAIVMGLGAIMEMGGAIFAAGGILLLVGLGVGMAALGAGLLIASAGFLAMSQVDWGALMNMGPALLSIAAAGAVGLLGAVGIGLMTLSLGGLAAVMVVLAPALAMAAASMMEMSSGMENLKASVKGLELSKLEELADVSERLSVASAIGNIASAVGNLVRGGEKEQETTKIELAPITIDLKLNGRDVQHIIIEDTKLLS